MRSFYLRGLLATLGFLGLTSQLSAADFGSSSLLPIPTGDRSYAVSPVGYRGRMGGAENLPSPSDSQVPMPAQVPEVMQSQSASPHDYQDAMSSSDWSSGGAPCNSSQGSCGDLGAAAGCGNRGYWFGGAGALIMRQQTNHAGLLSYDTANGNSMLNTNSTAFSNAGGVDAFIGRMFCGGNTGIMANYWGIYPGTQSATALGASATGALSSSYDFSKLTYDPLTGGGPRTVDNYYNNAVYQKLTQQQTINSFEVMFIGNSCNGGFWGCNQGCCGVGGGCGNACGGGCGSSCGLGGCGQRLGYGWGIGMRYFQYNDNLKYYSDNQDAVLTGAANELCYNSRTTNNLLGFQLAGGLNYCVCNRVSLYGLGRAGIYGNNSSQMQAVYGSPGDAWVTAGPYAGQSYRVRSTQTSLAFLGQVDLGARYQISKCWSLNGGYRIVGVSGLANAVDQIPSSFGNLKGAAYLNNNGSQILHGAYVGATFCF